MKLTDEELLIVLSEDLNMRRASERLFISQSALSQRLKTVEAKWDRVLFLRSQKGLTITPAGEVVIEYVKQQENQLERVKESLLDRETINGSLKLAVSSTIAQYWLPSILKKYVQDFPEVKIELTTGWTSDVVKGDFHIGIVRGEVFWQGVERHLFSDSFYLVGADYVDELENLDQPFIQFRSQSNYYEEVQAWWLQTFSKPPSRTITVDQLETCKQLALSGIGYSILPSICLEEGQGTKIDEHLSRKTSLIYSEGVETLPQVDAFIKLLEEQNVL
ncbi:LysR family transcriptional regulator [Halalkalibacillus halophilus]|uniref:LysR family transcriptional regulator n=1 Tax=Halalkalibacillus halophilus TaxID=392827 RepID=UPI0004160AD9|nr:LysR family transcriptional regulator [Halalkalibacillus halophilus]